MLMHALNPWRFGAARAPTVVIGYAACTVVWAAFTDQAIGFLNALFHGLDFRRFATGGGFALTAVLYGAVVLAMWAFLTGALFALVRNRLSAPR